MKKIILIVSVFLCSCLFSQNPLFIPDTLSGTTFNLTAQKSTKVFFTGFNTNTYGYNGAFLGPTLFMNKGDEVTLNVTNSLPDVTSVHWHGFHIPAKDDGSPYQSIAPGQKWSPSFRIRNHAGTYWYHPHIHPKTEIQIMKGLAGLIIIRDSTEASFNLPRTYGKDDFPIIVQTRIFDFFHQIATATHEDSVLMVNGTMNAYLKVPRQVVRFRLLNASADRSYNFGLSDNANFYVIASDGGLLEKPVLTKRLALSVGERAEVLMDFSNDTIGQQRYLMSYASELPRGVIGGDSVGTSTIIIQDGYYQNPLNGLDFKLVRLDVGPPTAKPVTTVPASFVPLVPISPALVNANRTIFFYPDTITSGKQGYVDGPFLLNSKTFHMDSVNITTYLNNVEVWSLVNKTMVAHPFHIHDVQFQVLDINGNPPPAELRGYKDVILVKPAETVRFITKFEDFASDTDPYMYHCHLLHHEDDGMMGSFIVKDTLSTGIKDHSKNEDALSVYQNFYDQEVTIVVRSGKKQSSQLFIADVSGRILQTLFEGTLQQGEHVFHTTIREWKPGMYFIVNRAEQLQCRKIIRNN